MSTCSFIVFLPGGTNKEWRHIVSANCDFEGETGPIVPIFTSLSGNTWQTAKIAQVIMTAGVSAESPLADVYPVIFRRDRLTEYSAPPIGGPIISPRQPHA